MYEVYESFILFDLSEQRIGISVEFLKNNMQLSQRHEIKDETTQPDMRPSSLICSWFLEI